MRYTVTRDDGAAVMLEYDPVRPAGYTVTDPADAGIVTEVLAARDVIGEAFDMAADARRELDEAGALAAMPLGGDPSPVRPPEVPAGVPHQLDRDDRAYLAAFSGNAGWLNECEVSVLDCAG
jgi:hypothetical protein